MVGLEGHLGTHRHGADDIESGERLNMIMWSHSSAFRASDAAKTLYQKEAAPPGQDRRTDAGGEPYIKPPKSIKVRLFEILFV